MKKLSFVLAVVAALTVFASCGKKDKYVLDEKTFFLVMTNVWYYPEQYAGAEMEFACYTYRLTDVDGKEYMCGVRKCASGYGCKCGKDTIIGFLLEYDGAVPEPIKQSEDSPEKAWIRVKGRLKGNGKTDIYVYAYNGDEIDYNTVEKISLLTFSADDVEKIEDYSGLNYYVS